MDQHDPVLVDVEEAAQLLGGLGHSYVRKLVQRKTLPSVKIGRRRLVPRAAIDAYVARLVAEQGEHEPIHA